MLPRNTENHGPTESLTWQDLTNGHPTIIALAQLCGRVMAGKLPAVDIAQLSGEARAILYLARQTGSISIRGDKNAFEPGERFLAICVELPEGHRIEFRCPGDSEQTIRFVEGFRQLCQAGFAMHQLMNDFSLTAQGFDAAVKIEPTSVEKLSSLGRETI